jgi:hypothetical protein
MIAMSACFPCQGADLVFEVPHPGAVDGGQAQHVPLVQVHGRDLLAAGQGWRVGPGSFRGQRQAHLGEQVGARAADGVDTEAGDDAAAQGGPGGREGAELHQHVGGWRDREGARLSAIKSNSRSVSMLPCT